MPRWQRLRVTADVEVGDEVVEEAAVVAAASIQVPCFFSHAAASFTLTFLPLTSQLGVLCSFFSPAKTTEVVSAESAMIACANFIVTPNKKNYLCTPYVYGFHYA